MDAYVSSIFIYLPRVSLCNLHALQNLFIIFSLTLKIHIRSESQSYSFKFYPLVRLCSNQLQKTLFFYPQYGSEFTLYLSVMSVMENI